ncbi:MAG: alpha/beta hydrolase [Aquificaceae bacterium]|nr:alpha/beta hydrolase [Aquificaceae bacterium]
MILYEGQDAKAAVLHLHGFASSVKGRKVSLLRELSKEYKVGLFAMDMDYQSSTTSVCLKTLQLLIFGLFQNHERVYLSASSHGGYVALNYLRFFRPCVKGVFLFAPSYNTLELILKESKDYQSWLDGERELEIFECETGLNLKIHKDFAKDIIQNGYEIITQGRVNFRNDCKSFIRIYHGKLDAVIPYDLSEAFAKSANVESLTLLDDNHELSSSFTKVAREMFEIIKKEG